MENAEEILHCLEEFSKFKPKNIPRELEEYLCFVAKTGDPIYQWSTIKGLFREKLVSVITEFYESCPSVEIPPCPNVDLFNYDTMKSFILEKLDTFVAAPFTVQRICELLTTPHKEYNRIDKYMRALEKNILVVSTTEPGMQNRNQESEGYLNGLESDHIPEGNNSDINIEEMDESPVWHQKQDEMLSFQNATKGNMVDNLSAESNTETQPCTSITAVETVITCCSNENQPYVSIEPIDAACLREDNETEENVNVTITAIPAAVQKRRDSIEPPNEQESNENLKEIHPEVVDTDTSEPQSLEDNCNVDPLAEKKDEYNDTEDYIFSTKEEEDSVDNSEKLQHFGSGDAIDNTDDVQDKSETDELISEELISAMEEKTDTNNELHKSEDNNMSKEETDKNLEQVEKESEDLNSDNNDDTSTISCSLESTECKEQNGSKETLPLGGESEEIAVEDNGQVDNDNFSHDDKEKSPVDDNIIIPNVLTDDCQKEKMELNGNKKTDINISIEESSSEPLDDDSTKGDTYMRMDVDKIDNVTAKNITTEDKTEEP